VSRLPEARAAQAIEASERSRLRYDDARRSDLDTSLVVEVLAEVEADQQSPSALAARHS
jgi:hypothetical protein